MRYELTPYDIALLRLYHIEVDDASPVDPEEQEIDAVAIATYICALEDAVEDMAEERDIWMRSARAWRTAYVMAMILMAALLLIIAATRRYWL